MLSTGRGRKGVGHNLIYSFPGNENGGEVLARHTRDSTCRVVVVDVLTQTKRGLLSLNESWSKRFTFYPYTNAGYGLWCMRVNIAV